MSSSLSNLADDLSNKCPDCKFYLYYMSAKKDQLIFRCLKRKKSYEKDLNKDLIKRFASVYNFCDGDINKFVVSLRKVFYACKYIGSWKRKRVLING